MKAKELIEYLKQMDPETPICVKTYVGPTRSARGQFPTAFQHDVVYTDMKHKRDIRTLEDPVGKKVVCIGHYDMDRKDPARKVRRKALRRCAREVMTAVTYDICDRTNIDKSRTELVGVRGSWRRKV